MELAKLNPDWEVAEIHGYSTFPGTVEDKGKGETLVCPCCLNAVHKTKAPLCNNSKELQFLGFGFPLFYVFIKYCIIMLIVSIASYNSISLYWAIENNSELCSSNHRLLSEGGSCTSFMIEFSRLETQVTNAENIVRISSFLIQMMVLIYIRDLITKTMNYYDERTCSLSDYSILITNLPKKTGTRRNLLKMLQKCYQRSYNAYQITFLPQYQDFYKLEEEREELINKKKKLMNEPQKYFKELQYLQKQLSSIDQQIIKQTNKQIKLEENDECLTQKIIFSCESQDAKEQIMENFDNINEEKLREVFQIPPEDQCEIEMCQAPEPKEIQWEFINYPPSKRYARMMLGWTLTALFLGIITIIFFFVLSAKSQLIEHSTQSKQSYEEAVFLVYLALVCVILFNKFVMGMVLHKICDLQLHPTTAQFEFHFAFKYAVGMFFTTALMTLAVQDIRFHNFNTHPYGVIEEETVMFMMNAFFVPLIWLINPWQIHVLIRRKLKHGRTDLTQKQANKIMENMQYNMGKRYAEIIEVMWFTYLYSSLIPFGAFMSAIGLSLYYWVDKYNLLRRSSANSNIAGELSIFSMKLLDFSLLAKPLGEIIFDSQIRASFTTTSLVLCAIALLYLVLPIDDFLDYFHNQKFKPQQKQYEDVQHLFKETYQTLHPIFSLKKENQQKMFKGYALVEKLFEDTAQNILGKSVNEKKLGDFGQSPKALVDASNILQSLFKRHNYFNFNEKQKQKENQP